MEDSRNIIKAIDALTLKAGGEVVDSKNITEAIDNLRAVYDQEAIGIDTTLTKQGLAADAKAAGDKISALGGRFVSYRLSPGYALDITFSSRYTSALIFYAIASDMYGLCIYSNGYLATIPQDPILPVTIESDEYRTVTVHNTSTRYPIVGVINSGSGSVSIEAYAEP